MLDSLISLIETLQERLRTHYEDLQRNETRTRMALIDPLLSALGWDTADPSAVTPEYDASGGRADYALLGSDGKPAAFIEAKKLREALEPHRMQMLNYSNASGIKYAGLTDGNHWELYEVFVQASLEERRRLDLRISDRPAHESALQFLLLWRPNLASGQPIPANEPVLEPQVPSTAPSEPVQQTATASPTPVTPKPDARWISLSEYEPPVGTNPPFEMQLPDGKVHPLKSWYEIPLRLTEWLWSKGQLTLGDIPVPMGANRHLISTEAVHASGRPFAHERRVPNTPLTLETNMSAAECRRQTRDLLTRQGQDPTTVYLRPRG